MEAVCDAARTIAAGEADVCLAGGSESMTRAPFVLGRSADAFSRGMDLADTRLGWRLVSPRMQEMYPPITLGETAENVAEKYGITREPYATLGCGRWRATQAPRRSGTRWAVPGRESSPPCGTRCDRRGAARRAASMCIGVGQGIASLWEAA